MYYMYEVCNLSQNSSWDWGRETNDTVDDEKIWDVDFMDMQQKKSMIEWWEKIGVAIQSKMKGKKKTLSCENVWLRVKAKNETRKKKGTDSIHMTMMEKVVAK